MSPPASRSLALERGEILTGAELGHRTRDNALVVDHARQNRTITVPLALHLLHGGGGAASKRCIRDGSGTG